MRKILDFIEHSLDSLLRFISNRRNRDLAPFSMEDLRRMQELNHWLAVTAEYTQKNFEKLNSILENAYNLNRNEMSS